jgi:hypothetical protein
MENEKWEREGRSSNEEIGMMNWEEWGRIGRESKEEGQDSRRGCHAVDFTMVGVSCVCLCLSCFGIDIV